jgi:hypothetical protein
MSHALVEFARNGSAARAGVGLAQIHRNGRDAMVFDRGAAVVRAPGARYFNLVRTT